MPSISGWSQTAVETRPILPVTRRTSRARATSSRAREAPHREVVVARPAEPAHARAAARDLHHELHGHLGVRGEDHGLGEAHGSRPAALSHHPPRAVVGGHGAVGVVAHLVPRGDVEAVLRPEGLEALARVGGAEEGLHHPRHHRLALAHRDQIGEGGERLGVQHHRRAPEDHQRVARAAVLRPERDAGEAQHLQHVEVVVLERDREGDRVEVPQRRPGLEARRAGCPSARARPCPRRRGGRPARTRRRSSG